MEACPPKSIPPVGDIINFKDFIEQAGTELCQAQHSLSLDLDTN